MADLATQELVLSDSTAKCRVEYHTITTENGSATLKTRLHKVIHAQATWAEDIGTTGHVIEVTITDNNTVTISPSGNITKEAYILLFGF
jgi:hypothetical protein